MEFAYVEDLEDSLAAWEYARQTKNGQRNEAEDTKNNALKCGSCGYKVHLVEPKFRAVHFRAKPHPKDCEESTAITEEMQGILKDTSTALRGKGAVIAPRREDPLHPTPAPKHVRETTDPQGAEGETATGQKRHWDGEKIIDRDRELLPKTILIHLLKKRSIFNSCVFSIPIGRTAMREEVGSKLIREIGELGPEDEGKYRYVWGKIHNTFTYTPDVTNGETEPKKPKIFFNGAGQNNKHLPSSVVLMMQENKALAQHFLGTSENVLCKNVWFIAYGKVVPKSKKGYSVLVYENWQLHVRIKPISKIEEKATRW